MKPENAAAVLLEGAQRIIKGKREFLELLVTAALAGGHVLIEDNPGLGKTTVAKTLAKLIEGKKGPHSIITEEETRLMRRVSIDLHMEI